MFRRTRRSVSERARFSTRAKIALLLPICSILVFGLNSTFLHTVQGGAAGPRHTSSGMVMIRIENIDQPASQWIVAPTRGRITETSELAGFRYRTESSSIYKGLFAWRTTMHRTHSTTVSEFHDLMYRDDLRLDRALQDEFGLDWLSFRDPKFRAHVLPAIEAAVSQEVLSWAGRGTDGSPTVSGSMAGGGSLLIEVRTPADRWEVIPKLFTGTIPLWIFLSVGLIALTFVSRERKANRWLAGRCPKCGYPRSSIREDCAECGLKYERPSHVTWDPKDGKVEP